MMSKLSRKRGKKRGHNLQEAPFPIPIGSITGEQCSAKNWFCYTGYLHGKTVTVRHSGDMHFLYKLGFFGKGNLSRSEPNFQKRHCSFQQTGEDTPGPTMKVLKRRVYKAHLKWNKLQSGEDILESEDEEADKNVDIETAENIGNYDRMNINERLVYPMEQEDMPSIVCHKMSRNGISQYTAESPASMDDNEESVCERFIDPLHIPRRELSHVEQSWNLGEADVEFWASESVANTEDSDNNCDSTKPKIKSHMEGPPEMAQCTILHKEKVSTSDFKDSTKKLSKIEETSFDDNIKVSVNIETAEETQRCLNKAEGPRMKSNENKDATSVSLEPQFRSMSCDNDEEYLCLDDLQDGHEEQQTATSTLHGDPGQLDLLCTRDVEGDVIVVEDSCDDEDPATHPQKAKWVSVVKKDPHPIVEHSQLSLEEAFFLSYGLGCLVVKHEGKTMDLESLWCKFCQCQKTFLPNYIAYHYYRSKGWVPKSGIKFACDFVLYHEGPSFYHGSYSVKVQLVDEDTMLQKQNGAARSWTSLSCLNRVTEQVAKELLFCYVVQPTSVTPEELLSPTCIPLFTVQEVLVSRWVSSQEREDKEKNQNVEEFP